MKDGIKTMIDLFCGGFGNGESNNRLAILQFSNTPVVMHYFSDSQAPEDLKAKVDQMVDFGGKTCTGDALIAAHDEIFQAARGKGNYINVVCHHPNLPCILRVPRAAVFGNSLIFLSVFLSPCASVSICLCPHQG